MKLPRDLSADDFAKLLARYGYEVTRQKGSHLRLTTQQRGEHHLTLPKHGSLRVGTLSDALADVADHLGMSRDELVRELFGRNS
jgi:predicted RNA binding protein YcfA (HicA-like mRNA interferase family)